MPVVDTPVHEKVREAEGTKYECWNKPRPKIGQPVRSIFAMPREWPFVMSEHCMYDMSRTDKKCYGCKWIGSGEENSEEIRKLGT